MITQIYSGWFQTHVQLTLYIQVLVTAKKLKVHAASHFSILKGRLSTHSYSQLPIPYPGHFFLTI